MSSSPAPPTPYGEREDKLPRWAQDLISDLRANAGQWQRHAEAVRLETNPAATDIVLDYYADVPIGLPLHTTIYFLSPDAQSHPRPGRDRDAALSARYANGALIVSSLNGEAVHVVPQASNTVKVAPMTRDQSRQFF